MLKGTQASAIMRSRIDSIRNKVWKGDITVLEGSKQVKALVEQLKPNTEDWDIVEAALAEM